MLIRCLWPPLNSWGTRSFHAGVKANHPEELSEAPPIISVTLDPLVDFERLTNNMTCALAGVKGSIGVLKDKLHLMTEGTYLAPWQPGDVLSLKDNFPCCRTIQAQDAAGHGGFTTTALTHEPQGLTLLYLETDIVNRFHIGDRLTKNTPGHREMHPKVSHL